MKRILLSLMMACLLTSLTTAQTLGDLARKNRERKGTTSTGKVFTNDNLPKTTTIASESPATTASTQGTPATSTTAAASAAGAEAEEAAPAVDAKEEEAQWRTRFKDLKEEIALLERELTVSERENKLRAEAFYGDAGTRLRDEGKYAADDRKYKAEAEEKKQKIADAKQKLEDLREELRKAGKPASWGE